MRIWMTQTNGKAVKGMHKTAPRANTTVQDFVIQPGVTFVRLESGRVLIIADRDRSRVTVK